MTWLVLITWAAIGVVVLIVRFMDREPAALRHAREARESALRDAVSEAAEQLRLPAPVETQTARRGYIVRGDMDGYTATLTAFADYDDVRVELAVPALPAELRLTRWPRGRAAEDIYLGMAVESGYATFDAHFCVAGPPEMLTQHARTLDRTVLAVVADSYSPAFDVSLGATELRLVSLIEPPGERPMTPERYVKLWRGAESVVRDGVTRRVFASPRS